MTSDIVIFAFLISLMLYGVISYYKSLEIKTQSDYYHTKPRRRLIISVIFGNLTLGTGLVYTFSVVATQGAYAFVAPLGVLIGYLMYSVYMNALPPWNSSRQSIFDILREEKYSVGPLSLYGITLLSVLLTFVFLVSFEIYVSAQLMAVLINPQSPDDLWWAAGVALVLIASAYTVLGGLRGVVETDVIQAFFIITMLCMLLWIVVAPETFEIQDSIRYPEEIEWVPASMSIVTVSAILLSSIVTQFYNITNIGIGSNLDVKSQKGERFKSFAESGIGLFFCLSAIVILGFNLPVVEANAGRPMLDLLTAIAEKGSTISILVSFVIVFGMVAVVLTTVDCTLIFLSQFSVRHVTGKVSWTQNLRGARLVSAVIGVLVLVPTVFLLGARPDLISALLTIVLPATLVVPVACVAAYFRSRYGRSKLSEGWLGLVYCFIVLMVWFWALYDLASDGGGEITRNAALIAPFAAAVAMAVEKYCQGRGALASEKVKE